MTGLVGSSVNFTWKFSGGSNGVRSISWGLKSTTGDGFINNGILVTIDPLGSNPTVVNNARASGSVSGNQFSGQVTFTLSSIKRDDERLYGCKLTPASNFETADFASVQLVVKGELYNYSACLTLVNNLCIQMLILTVPLFKYLHILYFYSLMYFILINHYWKKKKNICQKNVVHNLMITSKATFN